MTLSSSSSSPPSGENTNTTRKTTLQEPVSWDVHYQRLVEFRKLHGHTLVPKRSSSLGVWVDKQRQRKDRLNKERIRLLNEIGFCWTVPHEQAKCVAWWNRLRDVQQTLIRHQEQQEQPLDSQPLSFDALLTPSQLVWLRRQRVNYEESKLDQRQIDALNELHPGWWKTARERQWDLQYQELQKYKQKHGENQKEVLIQYSFKGHHSRLTNLRI